MPGCRSLASRYCCIMGVNDMVIRARERPGSKDVAASFQLAERAIGKLKTCPHNFTFGPVQSRPLRWGVLRTLLMNTLFPEPWNDTSLM